MLLDLLKHDPVTGRIPIHVISGAERAGSAAQLGAFEITAKPAEHAELARIFGRIAREVKSTKKKRPARPPAREADAQAPSVPELRGAKVLIVDDDIRNIYSLTSVLENFEVEVVHAERGRDGILILEQTPGIDAALIDIMMPEMDGYETMRQIRSRPALADVPLIAVTAKAMKGDRQKCLDAGASDYIAKPVDIELLLALLRVWIAGGRHDRAAGARSARHAAGRRMTMRAQPEIGRARVRSAALATRGGGAARAFSSSTMTSIICSRSARCSRTSPRSRSPRPATRRCAICSRASSRSSCSTSSCPAWTATRPRRSSAAASRPSASRSSSSRRSTRRRSI